MKDVFSNIEAQIESIDAKVADILAHATENYDKWNDKVNEVINKSARTVEHGFEKAEKMADAHVQKAKTVTEKQQERVNSHAKIFQEKAAINASNKALFNPPTGKQSGGMVLLFIGVLFAGILGLGILVMLILNAILSVGIFLTIARGILLPLLILFTLMAIVGKMMAAKSARFKKYVQTLNGETFVKMSDLAAAINKTEAYVEKDLQAMLLKNWFRQGFIVNDGKTLIVSRETFDAYRAAQEVVDTRIMQEAQPQRYEKLPEEAQAIVRKGELVLAQVSANKVLVANLEMRQKLSSLGATLEKIFKRVEEQPEVAPLMQKMMSYYLPTTLKLVDAYVELEKQEISGMNIEAAKTEIEATLITLSSAYEKLLDDLFADVMLDVSTDISVLNTMLKQDGLTDDGLGKFNA